MSVNTDKRNHKKAIPEHLESELNALQMMTLSQLEALGWKLWFVRRPMFQAALPVLLDPTGSFTAVIEENGRYNSNHGYNFRLD